MKKLDLEVFKALKSDVIYLSKQVNEKYADTDSKFNTKNDLNSINSDSKSALENLTDNFETIEDLYEDFRQIILILSEHDLSEIDFEQWEGMDLSVDRFFPIDFSRTNANLDFSKIHYNSDPNVTNFRSCNIRNFDFKNTVYSEGMFDENFVNENQQYFLNNIDKIPKKFKKRFYNKDLSEEEITQNKKLSKQLTGKTIDVGFKNYNIDENQGYKSPIYDVLKPNELRHFIHIYGKYISHVNEKTARKLQRSNFEEKKLIIEETIENNILNKKIKYDDKAPDFFKTKYPKLFIDDNAPEELKLCFYDGYKSTIPEFSTEKSKDYKIDSEILRIHIDWINKYLVNKEIKNAFSNKYQKLFTLFDEKLIMEFLTKDSETIIEMVEHNKEDLLNIWYKSEGGRTLPNYIVMLNIPEDEIDNFLINKNKWLDLMKIKSYDNDKDNKVALLKIAYALGVFDRE